MLSAALVAGLLAQPPAGLELTDALGRRVSLPAPPRRIAVTGRAGFMISDAAYAFPEARVRFVAVGRGNQGTEGLAPILDPGFADKAVFGPESGPEQIAGIGPDLVLMKRALAGRMEGPLGAIGIPVLFLDFETPEDFTRDIEILGRVFGNEGRARQLLRYYASRRSRVEKATVGLDGTGRPSVLLLYRTERDGDVAFNAPPAGWMQTALVRLAGGRPVWTESALGKGWTKVGFEQIAAWNADRILMVAYSDDAESVRARLSKDPQWRGLRAVKDGRLTAFPGDLHSWDQPTTRWILGLLWLAKELHPERLPGLDIRAEVRAFYREVYGMDDAAFERHIAPRLPGDLR
jgi:iron complex transport system substrate-binding protein